MPRPVALLLAAILSSCNSSFGNNGSAESAGVIAVGKNVQVSAMHANAHHEEVVIASDPTHARRLIACSMIAWKADASGMYRSTISYVSDDAGVTWEPASSNPIGSWDPDCAFDETGRAYFIAGTDFKRHRTTLRWTDRDGRWRHLTTLAGVSDRPWVSTGRNGRVYVTYIPVLDRPFMNNVALQAMRVSTDGGMHFNAPVRYFTTPKGQLMGTTESPGRAVVLPDGTYLQAFQQGRFSLSRGNDGAELSAKPNRVFTKADQVLRLARIAPKAKPEIHDFPVFGDEPTLPSVAFDAGSTDFKNRVYVAWADARSGRFQIYVMYSPDEGHTWSRPTVVNDDAFAQDFNAGPDDVGPSIAVNKNGAVGVSWEDRRENPDDTGYYIRFSASLDGGGSWLPSVRVSEAANSFANNTGAPLTSAQSMPIIPGDSLRMQFLDLTWITEGHTAGLTADRDGRFHPLWIDNRSDVAQMWTAPISVSGQATKYGDPALESFEDVSRLSKLDVLNATLNRQTQTISLEVRLKNTSKRTLHDVKVRILSLRSPLAGVITRPATYPLKEFLRPGAESRSQYIQIALAKLDQEFTSSLSIVSLLNLNVRVLARPDRHTKATGH